jgi:fructose-specific phosphotransferase system IIA component
MKLKEILSEDLIKVPLAGREKKDVIEEMVEVLATARRIRSKDEVLKAILEREALMSTGVGDGVAIPHGKAEAAPEIVAALGIAKAPVDFDAIDDKPVTLVWLLVGPPHQTGPHLKALSRISRLVHKRDFRERLATANSAADAFGAISREEELVHEV